MALAAAAERRPLSALAAGAGDVVSPSAFVRSAGRAAAVVAPALCTVSALRALSGVVCTLRALPGVISPRCALSGVVCTLRALPGVISSLRALSGVVSSPGLPVAARAIASASSFDGASARFAAPHTFPAALSSLAIPIAGLVVPSAVLRVVVVLDDRRRAPVLRIDD